MATYDDFLDNQLLPAAVTLTHHGVVLESLCAQMLSLLRDSLRTPTPRCAS